MARRPWVTAAALLCLAAAPVKHATPPAAPDAIARQLQDAERQRQAGLAAQQQAEAAAAAAQQREAILATQRMAAAARLRAAEDATSSAANRMADLAAQKQEAEHRLAQQAQNLGPLLPLIERLALYPTETLLAVPAPPQETLEGLLVIRGITRDMQRQSAALLRQRAEVAALTQSMAAAAPSLAAAEHAQANQAAALDLQIAAARQSVTEAEREGLAAAQAAATAAARAASLRDAIAAIEAQRAAAEAAARAQALADTRARRTKAVTADRARLAALAAPAGPGLDIARQAGAPVAGAIIRSFGQQTDAGPSLGIAYQPPPAALVVSPCAGKVDFAGPFRSYGLLLILDCGQSYHFVLAGLARLDAQLGHPVRQGEPIGAMAAWDPSANASRPSLYVELRQGGTAINPAPFLRARG